MLSRAHRTLPILVAVALTLAGCAGDQAPTDPGSLTPPPSLGQGAFQLTIDNRTGAVTVTAPTAGAAARAGSAAPSFSLLGSEAVRLVGSGTGGSIQCAWSTVSGNTKLRRCSFDLAVQNLLRGTDLVTPTSFPRPPAGVEGILVFPFAAAALSVPGSGATPSPDWDHAPYNFFNDTSGCAGKTSDCYRWELFPGTLYAGETTAARRVGFDVDKSATTVAVSIVVAADLLDDPPQVVAVGPALCGYWGATATSGVGGSGDVMLVGWSALGNVGMEFRGVCRFPMPAGLSGKHITRATLRFQQTDVVGSPYSVQAPLVADHMELLVTVLSGFDMRNFDRTALEEDIGTLSADATLGARTLDVTEAVRDDLTEGREHTDYRFRFSGVGSPPADPTYAEFGAKQTGATAPQLEVVYRDP
jgi:hypothetical protein